jgi:hypothetical protein
MARHRWIIERDYEDLKQELGLGHFEGRGWRGFHHHATLCIVAYGFLVAERTRFFPQLAPTNWKYPRHASRQASNPAVAPPWNGGGEDDEKAVLNLLVRWLS